MAFHISDDRLVEIFRALYFVAREIQYIRLRNQVCAVYENNFLGIRLFNLVRHYYNRDSENFVESLGGTNSVPSLVTPTDASLLSDTDNIFDGEEERGNIYPQVTYRSLEEEALIE